MKVVEPSVEILFRDDLKSALKRIETAARVCYKSENKISENSAEALCKSLMKNGHMAMFEHASVSVKIVCDRGISHEIVRHRIASYAQESTRYCNYASGKFNNEITVVHPLFFVEGTPEYTQWLMACTACENAYLALTAQGFSPQEARSVLPTSLKTEIVVTMNIREWIHFIRLRLLGTTGKPHPQMKQIADMILREFAKDLPAIFLDMLNDYEWEEG